MIGLELRDWNSVFFITISIVNQRPYHRFCVQDAAIKVWDFPNVQALSRYVLEVSSSPTLFYKHLAWKSSKMQDLSPQFVDYWNRPSASGDGQYVPHLPLFFSQNNYCSRWFIAVSTYKRIVMTVQVPSLLHGVWHSRRPLCRSRQRPASVATMPCFAMPALCCTHTIPAVTPRCVYSSETVELCRITLPIMKLDRFVGLKFSKVGCWVSIAWFDVLHAARVSTWMTFLLPTGPITNHSKKL